MEKVLSGWREERERERQRKRQRDKETKRKERERERERKKERRKERRKERKKERRKERRKERKKEREREEKRHRETKCDYSCESVDKADAAHHIITHHLLDYLREVNAPSPWHRVEGDREAHPHKVRPRCDRASVAKDKRRRDGKDEGVQDCKPRVPHPPDLNEHVDVEEKGEVGDEDGIESAENGQLNDDRGSRSKENREEGPEATDTPNELEETRQHGFGGRKEPVCKVFSKEKLRWCVGCVEDMACK